MIIESATNTERYGKTFRYLYDSGTTYTPATYEFTTGTSYAPNIDVEFIHLDEPEHKVIDLAEARAALRPFRPDFYPRLERFASPDIRGDIRIRQKAGKR